MVNVLPPKAHFKRMALDLFFPQWCIGCGREGGYICDECRQLLPAIKPPICPECGRPQTEAEICSRCSGESPAIDGIRSPFIFEGVIRQAIHELKYRNLRALVPALAGLLHKYLEKDSVPGDVLVPVPLHRKRLKERGYNQAALIAESLGRLRGLSVVTDCLVRQFYAPPQARSAGVDERHRNVAGAFTCRDGRLSGKRVIIIDDVATSGATLNAGAEALKAAGAAAVWGLVLALEP
jgi:competence protein ComFC